MECLLASSEKGGGVAHVIDSQTGGSKHVLKDCRPASRGMCATAGFVLAADSGRSFVHMWSWRKEQPRFRCQMPERLLSLVCTIDGAHCVGGSASGKLYLWEVPTGRLLCTWDGHFKAVTACATALMDGFLLSAGEDAILHAWNLVEVLHAADARESAPRPYRTWTDHVLPITTVVSAPCGQHDLIVSASEDRTVRLWRLSADVRRCVHTVELPAAVTALAVHACHSWVYAGAADGLLYAIPLLLEGGTPPAAGVLHTAAASFSGPVRDVGASLDGMRVFTIGAEPGVRVWDAYTLALVHHFQPTLPFQALLVVPHADALTPPTEASGTGAGTAASAPSSRGASGASGWQGAGAITCTFAPLKKFADPPLTDAVPEASTRSMGCVPCDVSDGYAWDDDGGTCLGAADGLPLLEQYYESMNGSTPQWLGHARTPDELIDAIAAGRGGTLGIDGSLAQRPAADPLTVAEATIRQLHGQVAQLQQANRELYELAADATLASGR